MSARLEAIRLQANRGSRLQALPVYAGRGMPRLIRFDWPARTDMSEAIAVSVGESPDGVASVPFLEFGAEYSKRLKKCQGPVGDTWHLDEVYLKVDGRNQYLWRAVDQDGEVIDILVQSPRDARAAERFLERFCEWRALYRVESSPIDWAALV